MAQQRMKPVAFARQEALEELSSTVAGEFEELIDAVNEVLDNQRIFKAALISALNDVEDMSSILVDAGLLTIEEDPELVGVSDTADEFLADALEDSEPDLTDEPEPEAMGDDPLTDDDVEADPEAIELGAAEPELTGGGIGRKAQIDRARQRRAIAQAQSGREAFEAANETSEAEAASDANDVTGIPEDGITVGEGRDPFTGEPVE